MRFNIPAKFTKKTLSVLGVVFLVVAGGILYRWHKYKPVEKEITKTPLSSKGTATGPGKIETYIKVPGSIDFHPKHALRIHPAFPGIAIKTFKNLGDFVNAGDTLATIESNIGIQTISVVSPIKGEVLSKNIGEGQSVTPEEEIFSIGETTLLQAKVFIPAIDVKHIKLGQTAVLASEQDSSTRATISFISPILSAETRSATALIDFTSSFLIPGMFVTAAVVVDTTDIPLSLPARFCANQSKKRVLFKVTDHGAAPNTVYFGARDYFTCEVLSGLEKGDEVFESLSEITVSQSESSDSKDEHHHED